MLRTKITIAVFFVLVFLILLAGMKTPVNIYDEGFAIFGSRRVANGEVPYKDFWAIYPPGQYYLIASAFRVFGETVQVSRLLDTVMRLVLTAGLFFILKKITNFVWALIFALIVAVILAMIGFYSYAVFTAMAFLSVMLLLLYAYIDTQQPRWLLLSGLVLGISAMVRWDLATYAAAAVVLTLWLAPLARQRQDGISMNRLALAGPLRATGLFLAPALGFALLGYGWVALQSGLNNMIEQVFVFPITTLPSVRRVGYPGLIPPMFLFPFNRGVWEHGFLPWLRFYLPLVIVAVWAVVLWVPTGS
jgi:4-amino-4-deoxy-L-arabinose transferase-like glycosyltransferase